MQNLKDLLPQKKFVVAKELDEKTVFFLCKKILIEEFGIRGAENLIPTFYKDKKLYLSPRSSLWANEAYLLRDQLLQQLNLALGCEEVKEIKIAQQI